MRKRQQLQFWNNGKYNLGNCDGWSIVFRGVFRACDF